MATELFSIWGFQTGWLSKLGNGYAVSAELDGLDLWYWSTDYKGLKKRSATPAGERFCVDFSPGWHLPGLTWA